MQDDLNRPLGLEREPASRFGRPVAWTLLAFGGLGLVAILLIAFVVITGDRNGGEPYAIARIEQEKPASPPPAAAPLKQAEPTGAISRPDGKSAAAEME